MKRVLKNACVAGTALLVLSGACRQKGGTAQVAKTGTADTLQDFVASQLRLYKTVRLTTNLNTLTDEERRILPLLLEAAQVIDRIFWQQAYPQRDSLVARLHNDDMRRFVDINYGPWDRLNNDKPFVPGVGPRYEGGYYYPQGLTRDSLEKLNLPGKMNEYSVIKKDSAGKYTVVPYHVAYAADLQQASNLLKQAALIATEPGLKKYLNLRADALVTDNYRPSDIAWLDMRNNGLDIVIGPIENYDDKLLNVRDGYESYVLVKDKEWSKKLEKYVALLPQLQKNLPVAEPYKRESPGSSSQLNAYDVVYYAGQANAGGKTIAINLPNDPVVQNTKGTRRLQLKNAMKAKFDNIMLPIARAVIDESQIAHVKFDAFFANTMFHEVAHGLGIKNTINGKGQVRNALQEQYSWLEEGKADILGLYMIQQLLKTGDLQGNMEDFYTTFMAGLLRSARFGAGEAHGLANLHCFNYFKEQGAFERLANGRYKVNYANCGKAVQGLSNLILTLQGNGDKAGVAARKAKFAVADATLKADLDKLGKAGIPVDVIFEQGADVLGAGN